MNTQDAISTLTALLATINSQVTGLQAQAQAIQVALDQLNGVLNTPVQDLQDAQDTIATLTDKVTELSTPDTIDITPTVTLNDISKESVATP